MAAMSGARLCKKVRHPWLGDARRLTMYLATLDCATSNPSLSSSPWMRGAPQSGFSTLIRRINTRSSMSICGRRNNEMKVEIVTEGRLIDIIMDGFDAGVRLAEAVPQDMIAMPLGPDTRHVVVGAPSCFATRPGPSCRLT
jgi:DNA-binding transcriptional LysR family regulator